MPDRDVTEQPEITDNYTHSPLNLESKEVRLLKIVFGSNGGESLHITIQHIELSDTPQFKAVSYTWGEAHPLFPIQIHGKPFHVRRNLAAFLDTISSDSDFFTDTWLWIDQLCIQQDNVTERNHQVRQMADIYRTASEVIVWLGPRTVGNKTLQLVAAEVERYPTSTAHLDEAASAVIHLLGCDYWTRTWVIQEFILAPSMALYWGTTKFGFDDLWTVMRVGRAIRQIKELIARRRRAFHEGFMIRHWKEALILSSATSCQDPRDRVYAMLGLVDPEIAIYPDYAASPKQILARVLAGVAVEFLNLCSDVAQQEDFLATKALVSRALGLGNRPLNELREKFFDNLPDAVRPERLREVYKMTYVNMTIGALWEWITDDEKHVWGPAILYEVSSNGFYQPLSFH